MINDCGEKMNPQCEDRFDDIKQWQSTNKEEHGKIMETLDRIENRLFVDNGKKSFQTFRNDTEKFISGQRKLFWILIGVVATGVGGLLFHGVDKSLDRQEVAIVGEE